MLQIMHETISLHDEEEEVGDGGDEHEALGALLDEEDVEHQHDDGKQHLDAFIDVKPGLTADLLVEVFLHHRAVECSEDENGRCAACSFASTL